MTRAEIISLIKDPGKIETAHREGLADLVTNFPYFQLGRMLHLRALHVGEDINYESALSKTAISVPDRRMLFRLVSLNVPSTYEEEQTINEPLQVVSDENQNSGRGSEITFDLAEDLPEQQQDELDNLIRTSTATYNINSLLDLAPLIEEDEETPEETVTPQERPDDLTFYDWLDADKDAPAVEDSNAAERRKRSAQEIIDEFIKKQPRIKPGAGDTYAPSETARLSLVDKDDMVTETLARIYTKQKNYSKAIEVYEKLMLKIPKKKGYFATQIHYLKNLDSKN